MSRQIVGPSLIAVALWLTPWGGSEARAQVVGGVASGYQTSSYYGAPGNYGTTWGVPSFGWPRTYSVYSSSYGPGYAGGYPPFAGGGWPGYYGGYGIWRPGFSAPGYAYGAGFAFPTPGSGYYGGGPAIGAYAPGFGTFTSW